MSVCTEKSIIVYFPVVHVCLVVNLINIIFTPLPTYICIFGGTLVK